MDKEKEIEEYFENNIKSDLITFAHNCKKLFGITDKELFSYFQKFNF